jgi:predicted phosphodiesterase
VRLAVLSDVHANLPALEAALAALGHEAIDQYVHAGDVVGYGPFPNECVERLAAVEAVGVVGNHDLVVLRRLPLETLPASARSVEEWTQRVLRGDARAYLSSLPLRTRTHGIELAHGSLDDPREYIARPREARRQLARLPAETVALVLGHTHRALAYREGARPVGFGSGGTLRLDGHGPWLLNPGSVGQSRDDLPRARFLVLDLDRREAVFHAIAYDLERCRRELRRHGLPEGGCWSPTRPHELLLEAAAARLRPVVRRISGWRR